MITKLGGQILELPFRTSMKFKNRKDMEETVKKIIFHINDAWGTYPKGERPIEFDYGYEFICRIICESDNHLLINNSISEYLDKRMDSIVVIESILLGVMKRNGSIILENSNLLKMHNILLDIYQGKVIPFENRYLEKEGIELFIEYVFVELLNILQTEPYFSIEELVFRYNNLFFPYFFEVNGLVNNNFETVSKKELSKKVSQLKKEGGLSGSDIIELRNKGVLSNYVNKNFINTLEKRYRKLKRILGNTTFAIDKMRDLTEECIELRRRLAEDFTPFLDISSDSRKDEWSQSLNAFLEEKWVLVYNLCIVDCIVEDLLSYEEISINFSEYEESFWSRYYLTFSYFSREEAKELYYLVLSFILLYGHRIRFGKIDYRFFKYLCNTFPEYKKYIEKVRPIFEGTKGSTVFSKGFSRFISNVILPDLKINVKSKEKWKILKNFINDNKNKTSSQDVIFDNIKYTEKKINRFLNSVEDYYNQIVEETNKKVIQLNSKEFEIVTAITEPPRENELNIDNTIIIGNFENNGHKELAKIEKGEYSKLSIEQLYSPEQTPEIRFMLNTFFGSKKYLYKMVYPDKQLKQGIIYFYDLDGVDGRYKTFDNIGMGNEAILNETRYGRFSIDLFRKTIYLSGDGSKSRLGKYRMTFFKIEFNWEDELIVSEVYHKQKGTIIVQFKKLR